MNYCRLFPAAPLKSAPRPQGCLPPPMWVIFGNFQTALDPPFFLAQYITNFQESVNICISSMVLYCVSVVSCTTRSSVASIYAEKSTAFFSETGNASLEDSKTRSHFGEGRRPLLPIYLH